MNYTTNLNLKKPESTDFYDVDDQNDNMDTLDTEVHKKADGIDYNVDTGRLSLMRGESEIDYVTIKTKGKAGLLITCDDNLIGATFTITDGSTTYTETMDSTKSISKELPNIGSWTVSHPAFGIYAPQSETITVESLAVYPVSFTSIKLAKITVTCTSSAFIGETVTVTATGQTTQTKTVTDSLTLDFYVDKATWTVSNSKTSTTSTVIVTEYATTYSNTVSLASIVVTCDDNSFIGQTITCSNGAETLSETVPAGKTVTFYVDLGTWTLYNPVNGRNEDPITVSSYTSYSFTMKKLAIVTFGGGTDEQIVAMVEASDRGEIDLSQYWNVGDERTISLSAMSATGVGESHVAQTATLVLLHKGLYDLKTATAGGRSKCAFIVGLKNSLKETGYMNDTNTNSGSWKNSKRRAWCNSVFYNAIPSSIRSIFKEFKTVTASVYNGSTNETTEDYFALPAGKEVFGADGNQGGGYSNQTEGNALTQFTYYATSANRIKKLGDDGSATYWWERSPYYDNAAYFCLVYSGGSASYYYASNAYGLAPFGCI